MKLKLILFAVLPFTLCAQIRNYDQELCNLLYGKRITEAQSYYAEYKNNIVYPFSMDSYRLISNMYAGKMDSVLLQLPVFIRNYYGTMADDNLLLFLPTFYEDLGEYGNGLKMLYIIEAFFIRKQNEGQGNEESLKNVMALKNKYRTMSHFLPYDQELCNLLYGKRITEAQSYYTEYKNNIVHPFSIDSYRLIFNIYNNEADSVISQLPEYIDKYYGSFVNDDILLFLPTFYEDLGEYGNGLKMLDIIEAFFIRKQNEGQGNEKSLENVVKLKKHYEVMSRFPKMEIGNPNNTDSIHVPMQTDPLIIFEAQYNQTSLKTIFDTGTSSYFFMQRNHAERAGIKMMEPYWEILFNGKETRSAYGIIDSIRIGSLLIKNIPVVVVEDNRFIYKSISDSTMNKDKLSKADSISNLIEIIMGLPMIKMLNHVCLDLQKNDLIVSLNHKGGMDRKKNMYIENNRLYLYSKIEGLDFTPVIDSGGALGDTAIIISNHFYEKLVSLPSNSCPHVFKTNALNVQIGNNAVNTFVKVDDQFPFVSKDGYIGLAGLLKKLKKVTFDFKSMWMDCK